MATLDNPAGRLHGMLSAFREAADKQTTILDTWASVLEVSDISEVASELAGVASLLSDIEQAVQRAGREEQVEVFQAFRWAWAVPMLALEHPPRTTPSSGKAVVDPQALTALAGLSAFLSATASEGVVPDVEQSSGLRSEVEALIETLVNEVGVPTQIQRLMSDRLHDMLSYIDHLR